MDNLMRLVLALENANVTAQQDTRGAFYALEGLRELEDQGWKFIPPPEETKQG